ncbi:MAG TPA: SdiA-regulated domain-containing protein [Chitinophagaceae bacterium]
MAELLLTYIITNRRSVDMTKEHQGLKRLWESSKSISFFVLFAFVLAACGAKKASYDSPPGYDFAKPFIFKLPTLLDEISGVIYYPKDSAVFAIQDEKGWLFKIHLKKPLQIERWKFSKGGDYEDIARVDSAFFVLKSRGVIEKFQFSSPDSVAIQSFKIPADEKNEFETLFYDPTVHQLVAVCKNCEDDKKKEVSTWSFNPVTDSFSASFAIKTAEIRDQLNEEDLKFKPSAAAVNPLTGELYIIASVNKALVILNKDHSVKNCYKIDPGLFKQPEGITFTPGGDLIISNEAGGKGQNADILFFKYNKPKSK